MLRSFLLLLGIFSCAHAGAGCCGTPCASNGDCAINLFCCPNHNECMGDDTKSTAGPDCDACGHSGVALKRCGGTSGLNATISSMADAAALAKKYYEQQTHLTGQGLCDHYSGVWYGLAHSGFTDANAHWAATPASYKLPGWEVGALAFWHGGTHGHGMSAPATPPLCRLLTRPLRSARRPPPVAIGDVKLGEVYSTDYPKALYVGHASTATISSWVGSSMTFKGWYKPYFK